MQLLCVLISLALRLNVIPLRSYQSYTVLKVWLEESIANEDINRINNLRRMIAFEHYPSLDKATISIVMDGNICAVGQLTKPPLTLVDIETSHVNFSAGTLLLRSIVSTNDDIHISHTLEDRWKIAYLFFKK